MSVESRPQFENNVDAPKSKVVFYASPGPFVDAINFRTPDKVFSFITHQSIDGEFEEVTQDRSFIDREGTVHQFHSVDEGADHMIRTTTLITRAMDDNNVAFVEGSVKVDPKTGERFFIYETTQPDKQKEVDGQMSAWQEGVRGIRDAEDPGCFEYFPVNKLRTVVDFVNGTDHHMTVLYANKGYEVSDVQIDFCVGNDAMKKNHSHRMQGDLPLSTRKLK